jgi:hypothetical protein
LIRRFGCSLHGNISTNTKQHYQTTQASASDHRPTKYLYEGANAEYLSHGVIFIIFSRASWQTDCGVPVPVDAFISIISFFMFLCGGVLVWAAWPQHIFRPTPIELLAFTLGGVMVLASGYGFGLAVA